MGNFWLRSEATDTVITGILLALATRSGIKPNACCVKSLMSELLSAKPFIQGNNKKHFGVREFANAAPKLWNSLPITLREHNSKETFKKNLKTYLFSEN